MTSTAMRMREMYTLSVEQVDLARLHRRDIEAKIPPSESVQWSRAGSDDLE